MNFQNLTDFLDYYLPMLGIPGSDTVIYKDHEEVYRHSAGFDSLRLGTPVRRDALYNMYSITKVSTGVAAAQLVERGEILASDPVYAYFPEFKDLTVKKKNPDGTEETVRAKNPLLIQHLLNMTGGISYDLERPAMRACYEATGGRCPTLDMVRAMAKDPFDFEPGSGYKYSLCLDIMGGIIELVSGMKLGEYMRQNIFEPLGMKNTTFALTDEVRARMAAQYDYDEINKRAVEIPVEQNRFRLGSEYESAGAGLISCVDDQILLADALSNDGVGKNGNRILSKAGVSLMSANGLDAKCLDDFHKTIPTYDAGYGYGYGVRTSLEYGRNGNMAPCGEFGWDGARLCYMSCDRKNRIAVFHAEHMGAFHRIVIPRMRNIISACFEDID